MTTTSDTPMTVRAYAADGVTLLCEFPYFVALSVLDVYNNVGSFTFNYNLNSPGASNLVSDTDLQLAALMDRRDGNGFQEVWRGFYEQDDYDPSMSESAIVQATGRSVIAVLNNGIVYPKGGVGSTTTSWSFAGASPGAIMHDLLVAAQARGCFPLLTWDFTSGQDSSGAAWTHGFTNAYDAGTNLFDLLVSMAQGGLCDFSMTGFVLHMYNSLTTLAADKSSTVFIRRGREVVQAPRGRDRTQIATVMLAQGDNGLNVERVATTYGALGRKESFLSQSGVTDAGTLDFWADQALGAIDDQQVSYTPTYVVDTVNGSPIPWKDYTPGNYISFDVGGTPVKYQVNQIAVQCGPGGPTFVQPTLNDVFYSREVLLAGALNRLGSGAIISGPAVSASPQPGPNPTVPNAPAFVAASVYTAAYYSPATGTTMAQLELQWTTPTNTDATTMIDGADYLVQYRLATTPIYPLLWSQLQGKPWSTIQGNPWTNPLATARNTQWTTVQVSIDNNNTIVQGLICGETYQFQIACTDVSGNTSLFSSVSSFTTATDSVAPAQPDAPTVFASMVAVQVESDLGSASGGTYNLAQDLDHLEVHYSYDPSFTPVAGVGSATYLGKLIANAGMMTAKIAAVGTFNVTSTSGIYIKLIAVDESGNVSPPSPGSGVTATLIDDQHISSLSVSKLIAGTVTATLILGGTIATSLTGQRVQMDSGGIHAYDAGGNQTFSLSDSSPVITLGTNGVSGNSVTIDTSQVYPTIFLTSGVGNPASMSANNVAGSTSFELKAGGFVSSGSPTTTYNHLLFAGSEGIYLEQVETSGTPSGPSLSMGPGFVELLFYYDGSPINGGLFLELNGAKTDSSAVIEGYANTAFAPDPAALTAYASSNAGSGVTVFNIGYGVTMASGMCPVVQYSSSTTSSNPTTNVSANSTTGYTVTLSSASPGSFTIFTASFRHA